MQFNNLSVIEFNNIIKNIFDSEEMLFNCGVVGEISSFKITNNVAYFSIKDELAVLNCVWFSPNKEFNIGEKVKVIGRPNYYAKGGKLNFNVNFITSFGEGEIFRRFIELKEKLKAEGFFYNKKELPENIENIGIITSNKGAVIKDIISVTKRRNPNINLYIYPVKVQGINAENEIVKGFEIFCNFNKIDMLIVARGGGSNEDLSVFNTEAVAKACFKCNKPIISAVGHETDFTLLDLVADVRASTPSVAAEIAVKESKSQIFDIKLKSDKLKVLIDKKIDSNLKKICEFNKDLKKSIGEKIYKNKNILLRLKSELSFLFKEKCLKIEHKVESFHFKLNTLNPNMALDKGYAIIEKDGKKITDKNEILEGEILDLRLKNKTLKAKILKVEK